MALISEVRRIWKVAARSQIGTEKNYEILWLEYLLHQPVIEQSTAKTKVILLEATFSA
jgi:hypothetical protein